MKEENVFWILQYVCEVWDTQIANRTNRLSNDWTPRNRCLQLQQVNNQRHIYHLLTSHNSLDSEDDFRSGCQNVSQSHPK